MHCKYESDTKTNNLHHKKNTCFQYYLDVIYYNLLPLNVMTVIHSEQLTLKNNLTFILTQCSCALHMEVLSSKWVNQETVVAKDYEYKADQQKLPSKYYSSS